MSSQYLYCLSEYGHALTLPAALPQNKMLPNWYRCLNRQPFPTHSPDFSRCYIRMGRGVPEISIKLLYPSSSYHHRGVLPSSPSSFSLRFGRPVEQ